MIFAVNPFSVEAQVRTPRKLISSAKQSGIVLPVALFMLVAATLLTLALVKANMISLRVGGASVIAAETQAAAELQLSNFFSLNLIVSPDQKYFEHWSRCSVTGDDPAVDKTIFDCRPRTTPPVTLKVQPVGCYGPPRSEKPSSNEIRFNYQNVMTEARNDAYGSRAELGAGVSTMIPNPKCL